MSRTEGSVESIFKPVLLCFSLESGVLSSLCINITENYNVLTEIVPRNKKVHLNLIVYHSERKVKVFDGNNS